MRRVLISSDEAKAVTTQHRTPCSDCPWRVDALAGWLGVRTVDEWLKSAHADVQIFCHVRLGAQCAGSAIYRRNVCKLPRDPEALQLPADREKVFATPTAFRAHHESEGPK